MQADPVEAFFRMLGWGTVLGVGELMMKLAWRMGPCPLKSVLLGLGAAA